MPDHNEVYKSKAEQYELLISKEDYLHKIPQTLTSICSFENADIIDLGAGTGRLTCLFAPRARSMTAFDVSEHMLEVTAEKLRNVGLNNWKVIVADHRSLPIEDKCIDIAMAGWSICYIASSNITDSQNNIWRVILEMKRVVRPGGYLIILETLGTGNDTPQPPDFLQGYYKTLECDFKFSHISIRTDYMFASVEEAEVLTRFFFGNELADKVSRRSLTIVPECTGIWWLRV